MECASLPEEILTKISTFSELRTPSAEVMRGLCKSMYWDGEDSEEGFLFFLASWRRDPLDSAIGGKVKQFQVPGWNIYSYGYLWVVMGTYGFSRLYNELINDDLIDIKIDFMSDTLNNKLKIF